VELRANILVLDDEPLVRLLICSGLERVGALVTEAECCAEAIRLAQNTEFDVVVFDYRLPDGTGLEVASRLRDEGFTCPVIMLSGEALDIADDALGRVGVFAVLPKPPDLKKIIETIRRATEKSSVQETVRVGRYAYGKIAAGLLDLPAEWANKEWLAIDCSEVSEAALPNGLVECVSRVRGGIALVGTRAALRDVLQKLNGKIEFVSNVDELAALSRRPTSPSERAALMGAVIQRE